MKRIRFGVICPSEIAFRRFMPAILKCESAEYIGIASADAAEWFGEGMSGDLSVIAREREKADAFQRQYGGRVYRTYHDLLASEDIDAVYLPLPPALHFKWAQLALQSGKHALVEKPSTTSLKDTTALVTLAKTHGLALYENYMFAFHKQIEELRAIAESGRIGQIRLYRMAFGFPMRAKTDFRYNRALGGGSLLDCGGYTLKLADMLLGETARVAYAQLNGCDGFEVDMYGNAALVNNEGVVAQISFGMDNSYKCELEIWGSKGCIRTGRIFTAPVDFIPSAEIAIGNEIETLQLSADDTFLRSIEEFCLCIRDEENRKTHYRALLRQAGLVEEIREKCETLY